MSERGKGTILFVYNQRKRGAAAAAAAGKRWCQERGIPARTTPRRRIELDGVELVVAIGGDGTLLRVANAIYPREIPVFGVNAGGALGFLSAGGPGDLPALLDDYLSGNFRLEQRVRLRFGAGGQEFSVLNDVVFTGPGAYRFTQLEVIVDGERAATFAGDGIVVSTPTGSTAYALACGAPIVHPTAEAIILVPIAPHSLRARPIVLPAGAVVTVKAGYATNVFADGDRLFSLRAGEELRISEASVRTVLVRFPREEKFFARVARAFGGLG